VIQYTLTGLAGEHVVDVTVGWQAADPLERPATVRRVIRLATDTNVWEDVIRTEAECRAEGRYWVRVFAGDQQLAAKPFAVVLVDAEEGR
jgi:hypothetical protein